MLTIVGQEEECRNGHMTLSYFADYLRFLVQNWQADHYSLLGGLELNCSQDVCCHLHRVAVEKFQLKNWFYLLF